MMYEYNDKIAKYGFSENQMYLPHYHDVWKLWHCIKFFSFGDNKYLCDRYCSLSNHKEIDLVNKRENVITE